VFKVGDLSQISSLESCKRPGGPKGKSTKVKKKNKEELRKTLSLKPPFLKAELTIIKEEREKEERRRKKAR